MKRIITLLLCAAMMFMLTSCGKGTKLEVADYKKQMYVGEEQTVTVTAIHKNGTPITCGNEMKLISSDENVVKPKYYGGAGGEIVAVGAGTATITVKFENKEKKFSVEVIEDDKTKTEPRIERFDLEYNDTMAVGEEQRITAHIVLSGAWPDIAPEHKFESSDEKIITVDESGLVYAVAAGTAQIIVRESTAEKRFDITVYEEQPIPFSKHAQVPKAYVTIDGNKVEVYHETAVSQLDGVIGDGADVLTSNYVPNLEKITFTHFCRDSYIDIMAGGCLPLGSVIVYDAKTMAPIFGGREADSYIDVGSLGGLKVGRYILKFRMTDRGNGAFSDEYITEVFFAGIEITEELPHIDPGTIVCYKPIIYLYPTETTEVTLRFGDASRLITTYPKYDGEWRVLANVDGTLEDESGRQYYALFYDELTDHTVDFKTGFYVTAGDAIPFLEEKLARLGFTPREADEFIMFWLPVLEKNGQSVVYFELTDERDAECPIEVTPAPDSALRVIMHVKQVDAPVDIAPQTLPTFERRGFTLVEWGGQIY